MKIENFATKKKREMGINFIDLHCVELREKEKQD